MFFSFYQTQPEHLATLQAKHWDPLHDWIRKTYGVELNKTDSIFGSAQPEKTRQKMSKILEELDQWELAGRYRAYCFRRRLLIVLFLSHGACDTDYKVIYYRFSSGEKAT